MLLHKLITSQFLVMCLISCCLGVAEDREWTDASGHYQFRANLIAYDEEHVVLQKENDDLISIALKDLSEADQKFLESVKAKEKTSGSSKSAKTWTMKSGLKVKASVIEFGERELRLERKLRGKIYANDRAFDNLPAIYRAMIPNIVAHFEKKEIDGEKGLDKWLQNQTGRKASFTCQGVILELENGDRYAVPLFLFSDADQKSLKRGWERYEAAKDDEYQREKEAFYLRAQAQANAENIRAMREIAELNLQLSAYNAGLFDLWEVTLLPAGGRPMRVVVPGRDSRQATLNALQKYPNSQVGPVARVRNRNRRRF